MTSAASPVSSILDWLRQHVSPGSHLRLDSRAVQGGDIFLAYVGARSDGRDFIGQALERGASAIVFEDAEPGRTAALMQTLGERGIPALPVAGLKRVLGVVASGWYGDPSRDMRVIAVTGTNGKTSCTQWIARVLTADGTPCGVIGTLGIQMPDSGGTSRSLATGLTTPDAVALHRALADMRRDGVAAVAIEASSIGLAEGRMDGLHVDIAVFTNLTRDHLDYHGDMAAYEAEKARLFSWQGVSAAVVNHDDEAGRRLICALQQGPRPISLTAYTVEAVASPDPAPRLLRASDLHATGHGMMFTLNWQGRAVQIATPLLGQYNVSNLLAVAGVLFELGWNVQRVSAALSSAQPAPGRLQPVGAPGRQPGEDAPLVVVDYAHTPDALARALEALVPVAQARGGRRICLFGCGGDRDPGKRPEMARVACIHADMVMVTSDNPRSEPPQAIIEQILAGVPAGAAVRAELDRARAIRDVVAGAHPNDIILLAGKGHEAYQEIGGVRHPFSDVEQAMKALSDYRAAPAAAGLMTLADAAGAMQGVLHGDGAERTVFSSVGTDSRNVAVGELFFALSGERFDGHAYVRAAGEAGAVAAVVQRPVDDAGIPQIIVADTRRALGELAAAWRNRFVIPLVAVTGSNGKTTTKEMIAAILAARHGLEARLATQGNFNNEIGLPLTLMRLRDTHRCAVVELGMNHPGEIAQLARIAAPSVALVNNAQREHQEFMHTVEAVARENGAVIGSLGADGVAVFPGDDAYTHIWAELAGTRQCLRFGLGGEVDVTAEDIRLDPFETRFLLHTPQGRAEVVLAAAGLHNVRNALAAAACALAAGVDLDAVVRGLAEFAPVKGRMQRHRLPDGALLIDDTYNANPDSVRAAIDVLATLPQPRMLVLGDMGEVGDQGPAMHAEVGAYAKQQGIDALFALGEAARDAVQAFGEGGMHADTAEQVASAVMAAHPASVLVKGSRFMRMERVVQALQAGFPSDHPSIGNSKHAA
ncbi:MAG: bifunctional UDP-N-acetylmuramoyl-L-alanyl-D-glutamate--2,6-diaminopimelate ligase MurE/UDP-N-acetylmuramoyl-tripeptide--D-alanyl-D-alanine ligase MurF [Pigmentiphaga sp.]|uniref:bifunctional UDP-N-acetylmuramoyl-L-alanyl-D-glutamate--2, 6-diaminopimelate ligase MurE/UDP-N-acetylmuramoyl-tripeptide--D-alanyl-D-alanine ligase MurF n=1 Tax=Pigmentiphaga sp. TaxID=1977564 RepID=UPI0029B3262C|nr:bifunctional UDP-N-acetylmuramoyl-L-alanyl-D-glutamate--2,6-diaminopimelate ligase MurE/UDP-N-acetylmuramoyl-tripeptide--D-alanyl-D-alanine ligase MurF [Pigmentiphaga sp.]MDX3904975.1 bifunctional UDP-N-acetylmuramoyl-L-alanyl-D-glutamate--2,6-diaminopimelate ligase MurE/UDP-N-acetylmuramoyl-tripeptide--D-alanyl-D-alanine ligase MurF [Pigmentiphaga sp.]